MAKENLSWIHKRLLSNPDLRKFAPTSLKQWVKALTFSTNYSHEVWAQNNPYRNSAVEWGTDQFMSPIKIGILFDPAHYHRYYISACLDLKLDFKVIDILTDKWVEDVENSGCDAFVVWPHLNNPHIKDAIDERLYLLHNVLKKLVYPKFYDIYLLDNKRSVRDWLLANKFDSPKTSCFFHRQEALKFINQVQLPIVSKTVKGSVARGVKILRTRKEATEIVEKAFSKGITPFNMDPRIVEWDFILLQEYLPQVTEQRMIRIGNSFLAIDKVIKGDFHSGSGTMFWAKPSKEVLDMTRIITDAGNFESMNVDFFVTTDGRLLVNELHSLFHGPEISTEEGKGRYLYNEETGNWDFEPGNFYRNYCCNLRLLNVLEKLQIKPSWDWLEKPNFMLAEVPEV